MELCLLTSPLSLFPSPCDERVWFCHDPAHSWLSIVTVSHSCHQWSHSEIDLHEERGQPLMVDERGLLWSEGCWPVYVCVGGRQSMFFYSNVMHDHSLTA